MKTMVTIAGLATLAVLGAGYAPARYSYPRYGSYYGSGPYYYGSGPGVTFSASFPQG